MIYELLTLVVNTAASTRVVLDLSLYTFLQFFFQLVHEVPFHRFKVEGAFSTRG